MLECEQPGAMAPGIVPRLPLVFAATECSETSSRAGLSPAVVQRLFTAHCYANYGSIESYCGLYEAMNRLGLCQVSVDRDSEHQKVSSNED
jgi:hypothetical protein